MFLSSYEKLRDKILLTKNIDCMVHMANMVMGIAFGTAATVIQLKHKPDYKGSFSYVDYKDLTEDEIPREFPIQNERLKTASSSDFIKIPGSPIAYWVSEKVRDIFAKNKRLADVGEAKQGLATADNNRFLRFWAEVHYKKIGFNYSNTDESNLSKQKWFPYNKGGEKRKWYGNQEFIVNWENNGKEIKGFVDKKGTQRSVVRNPKYYFKESISWGLITSGGSSFRYFPKGFVYDVAGMSYFTTKIYHTLGILNTNLYYALVKVLNPTINLQIGDVANLPNASFNNVAFGTNVKNAISVAKKDWDFVETSWGFTVFQLISQKLNNSKLEETYSSLRQFWKNQTLEMQKLEEENNRIFIEAYDLQDELTPEVPLEEITLTCNPYYRYKKKVKNQEPNTFPKNEELEARLLTDTIKEFVSYSVGCMMGRYSLDVKGLAYAGGEFDKSKYKTYPVDDDAIIPILDSDYFDDDIVSRFVEFLKVTFDKDHLSQNLEFVAKSLGKVANETALERIRKYFLSDFYKDHLKTYKKRPIYWMFSSGKEKAFNALVYLHRYNKNTLSQMRTEYLHELQGKLELELKRLEYAMEQTVSATDKRKFEKRKDKILKQQSELIDFDARLQHLADKQIELDLDDGVKVNYPKFGDLLVKVKM